MNLSENGDQGNTINPNKLKFEIEYFPFQVFMPAILVTFSWAK